MTKTPFKAKTYEGGHCTFFIEDVKRAELVPRSVCNITGTIFKKRVRVDFIDGEYCLLAGSEYEWLSDKMFSHHD